VSGSGRSGRVRFGLFDFDAATRELRREGTLVRLQPQPAEVLALLVARAGEVVSRDALREAIWGADTFVDFDRGLNFCIAQIRSALGDSVDSPRFIRTIPKRGYQFFAPVEKVEQIENSDAVAGSALSSATISADRQANTGKIAVALLVVVVSAIGFAAGRWWTAAHANRPLTLAVLRFDNDTGNPAFNPFADALTDTVVAQLTAVAQQRFAVIGNAAILRRPRAERDPKAIASSLGAGYVILGQVQPSGSRVRVLAHLIRLPEQTHVWVTRVERAVDDPLAVQLDIAETIARDVAQHLLSDSSVHRSALLTDSGKRLSGLEFGLHFFLAAR
jgi:DNA-binding winged helix-turn-helix (wHTH) protein/TolB-like protein